MMTVRQTAQALAAGVISIEQAVQQLRERTEWDLPMAEPTDAQLFGVDDISPPGVNSPDQINMVPGLNGLQRRALWDAVPGRGHA